MVSAEDRARFVSHHTLDWVELPFTVTHPRPEKPSIRPARWIGSSRSPNDSAKAWTSQGRYVRVRRENLRGEMTLYSYSGLHPIQPDSADFTLGAYWELRPNRLQALWAILARRREIRRPAR